MLSHRSIFRSSFGIAAAFSLLFSSLAYGGDPNDIVKVEEDWELTVSDPDQNALVPQICNAYSPIQDDDIFYGMLNMNHYQSGDEFYAGGIQLQLWYGDTLVAQKTSEKRAILLVANERIQWTQEIQVQPDGKMTFRIKDGVSETWGAFGNSLAITVQTSLTQLNTYKPSNSLLSSGTFYGSNRVRDHQLNKVRVTRRSGDVETFDISQFYGDN